MTKDVNMRHLDQLLSLDPNLPVHALVVNDAGLTETFISAGHSKNTVVYAALSLLEYASKMCADEGDHPLRADIEEFVEILGDHGYSITVEPKTRPLN